MSYLRSWHLGFRCARWRCVGHNGDVNYTRALHEVGRSPDHRDWPNPIYASDRLQDRKSVFLAHASNLSVSSALPAFLCHLTNLPSLKRATHRMYAYRISDPNGLVTGQCDGGESGSGDRLARLLESAGCHDVVVVVTRWYGGVKLGSDRWKRISYVAKEALARGNFSTKNSTKGTASIKASQRRRNRK